MFKIVALIYVITAGQPFPAPLAFTFEPSFDNLDACTSYLRSPETTLVRSILARRAAATIEDDDSIPGIAVTASCEKEDRL